MTTPIGDLSDDEIDAVADPVERGRILRAIAVKTGTLTESPSAIWTRTVAELAGQNLRERRPGWIAEQLSCSAQRIGADRIRQIIRRARRASELATEVAA